MTLTDDSTRRITLLHQAATRNGSLISIRDLSRLLPNRTSEAELAEAITTSPDLRSRFELRGGYLTERHVSRLMNPIDVEAENRKTASANMKAALEFASFIRSGLFKMVSVSGSTSYGSASLSKDLDLFCVAPPSKMWVSLSMGLVLARAFRLAHRHAPKICLSCIMDEDFARSAFSSEQDPLFARDAVETKILQGGEVYRSLMRDAGWISRLYPQAYDAGREPTLVGRRPSDADRILNRIFFNVVGMYLKLKASLLNRRLTASGRPGDVFSVRCGEDHLVYESRRYSALRREYEAALGVRTDRQGI